MGIKNIDGFIFGDLVILGVRENRISSGKNKIYEKVRCKCGKEYFTRREHLMGGRINNCGCDRIKRMKKLGKNNKTHGMEGTRIYNIFRSILQRCEDKNCKGYTNYGLRGIKCGWKSFEKFHEDMHESYDIHYIGNNGDTTIDRIDVNGNYSKENCRWATMKEQANNKRNNKLIEYNGEVMTLSQWEERGFGKRIIGDRLKRGWDFEKALLTPPIKNKRHRGLKVEQIGLDGKSIKSWGSIRMASQELRINRNLIANCCKGKIDSYNGFIWKFA